MERSVHTDASEHNARTRLIARSAAVLASLLAVGALTVTTSRAAFTATTDNGSNQFTAGTVSISDDDNGGVMFSLSNLAPGVPETRCINVTYTGSLPSNVALYGVVGGTGLAAYLDTTIEIGTGATGGNTFDCAGFSAGSTLYTGTLDAFGTAHTDFATGLTGWSGATTGTSRSYRVTVNMQSDNAAQGLGASTSFTWEAQNQ